MKKAISVNNYTEMAFVILEIKKLLSFVFHIID